MSRVFATGLREPEEFAGLELKWPSEASTSFSTEGEVTGAVLDWELPAHESSSQLVERRVTDRTIPPPSRLAVVRGYGGKQIKVLDETAGAYLEMVAAARRDGLAAPLLEIVSGFRDPKRQEQLWQQALNRYGSARAARRWVAPPGHSVHQTGRALDLWLGVALGSKNVIRQRTTRAYQWMVQNAVHFGFYPYLQEPWHWEYNPPISGGREVPSGPAVKAAPALIKREVRPPASTVYAHIPLGSENPARPMTGIYIPANYQPQQQVDLILYLHGFRSGFANVSIDGHWNRSRFPHFALREGVNASGKNVILVAPTLGPRSQAGKLIRQGGLDAYLDQVMIALKQYGPYQASAQTPVVGNIILACHSGGGLPMRYLALSQQRYTSRIRECWGFDCLYNQGDETLWAKWARSRPDAKLYIYFLSSTAARSRRLASLNKPPNVFVRQSNARGHNWVPITHWQSQIQNATFLQNL